MEKFDFNGMDEIKIVETLTGLDMKTIGMLNNWRKKQPIIPIMADMALERQSSKDKIKVTAKQQGYNLYDAPKQYVEVAADIISLGTIRKRKIGNPNILADDDKAEERKALVAAKIKAKTKETKRMSKRTIYNRIRDDLYYEILQEKAKRNYNWPQTAAYILEEYNISVNPDYLRKTLMQVKEDKEETERLFASKPE